MKVLKKVILLLFLQTTLLSYGASCPAGDAGKMRYAGNTYEFCNGADWISMDSESSAGSC